MQALKGLYAEFVKFEKVFGSDFVANSSESVLRAKDLNAVFAVWAELNMMRRQQEVYFEAFLNELRALNVEGEAPERFESRPPMPDFEKIY